MENLTDNEKEVSQSIVNDDCPKFTNKSSINEIHAIFSRIAKGYDLTNTLLSLGIHHLWKRKLARMIRKELPHNGNFLDLCCGTGDIIRLVGEGEGVDFCKEMLDIAKEKLPGNLKLTLADATALPQSDQSQDVVSIAFGLRNIPDYEKALQEIRRVLKTSGTLYILEFGRPEGRFFSKIYKIYAKYLLPLVGGMVTGEKAAYKYLYETSWNFPTGRVLEEILRQAGFNKTSCQPLSFGIAYIYKAKLD